MARIVFSIIIPVYNNPKGIENLIESLVGQDFPKDLYEIIVVNDGSKDKTASVINKFSEQYPDFIRCFHENKNNGPYAARNKGICHSRGEILAFIDSDCFAPADWLFSGLEYIRSYGASCVGGNILFTYINENKPNIFEYFDSATYLKQEMYVNHYHFAATANFFVKKKLFEKYGYFKQDSRTAGDMEFGIRLYRVGERISYAPNVSVYHPARSDFYSLFERVKRTSFGRRYIAEMGMLRETPFRPRQIIPQPRFPRNTKISMRLSLVDKITLTILHNIFTWVDIYYRHFSRKGYNVIFCYRPGL
jgi:glycosyltransferase involved in cell wall biosynthesis